MYMCGNSTIGVCMYSSGKAESMHFYLFIYIVLDLLSSRLVHIHMVHHGRQEGNKRYVALRIRKALSSECSE